MNIKNMLLASAVLVSVSSFAQKEELKSLKKIYAKDEIKGKDLADYKALVIKVEPLATEEGDKIYATFYKSMVPVLESLAIDQTMPPAQMQIAYAKLVSPKSITDLAAGLNSTLEYEKKVGKKVYTDDILETIQSFKPVMVDFAVGLGDAKKYKEAGDILYAIYQLDKKDQDKLFYAATYAVSGQNYVDALNYYNQLKALNYSGESTTFWAMNKATQKEETFPTKEQRVIFIKGGTHEKPRDEKTESRRGEIYKNIALILISDGKVDEAKAAVAEARKANPEDNSLIITEANLYINDTENYKRLVNEALAKDPNNAELVFNLGVVSAGANKLEEAEGYYKKALAIDPNYVNAYLNLSELKLRADEKFVAEMNKLGTSDKDNKRYEVIKADRDKNFKSVLPYLEKAVELEPKNEAARKTLISVYSALEMTDKAKALKAKQ